MSLYVDIHKKLGDFSLNVSFETGGECLGLLGASGCGKSITLRCIAGIITPDSGRIVLNDRVLFDSEKKINLPPQKRRVGYLFQNYALFPHMTVEQNIGIGVPKADRSRQQQIVDSYIEVFHLEDQRKLYPPQLSGGQQQRVALARILASAPEVLLLDEPFSALDEFLKEEMHFELQRTLDTYSGEVVMVTHSRDEVYRFCPELAVLVKGQIVDRGRMKELFDHPTKLATARLSGCKNISRAVMEEKHLVNALDWGIRLHIDGAASQNISYVGVRAHDIHPVQEDSDYEEADPMDNCFKDLVGESSSGPFETDVRLENTGLWWKLDTKQWKTLSDGRSVTEYRIDSRNLFLLEE